MKKDTARCLSQTWTTLILITSFYNHKYIFNLSYVILSFFLIYCMKLVGNRLFFVNSFSPYPFNRTIAEIFTPNFAEYNLRKDN